MESLLQDLRYAIRQLTKSPGFTTLAIATFALGIGPATAVLSFADRLLLAPIPGVHDAGHLAEMQFGTRNPRGYSPHSLGGAEYAEFVKDLPAIAALAGYQRTSVAVGTGSAPAEQRPGTFVGADYFRALGLQLQLGRTIGVSDDRADAPMVAVISHDLWQKMFGRAPDVVGKTFRANGEVVTVIGVTPKGFRGTNRLDRTDVWMAGSAQGLISHYPPSMWPRLGFYEFVLRLAPGATFESAQDQLRIARTRIAALHPEDKDYEKMDALVFPGIGVYALTREATDSTVRLLFGVTALLLVVACANAANLLLFRSARRRGETAVRQAIGATRRRLVMSWLTESAMLAVAGGIAGAVLAYGIVRLFEGVNLFALGGVEGVTLNWRVLALSLIAAVATGILSGVLPALTASRIDVVTSLKESQRTGTGGRSGLRSGLAVLQLAVSLALLVGSFLFIRTMHNLRNVSLGFDPSQVSSFIVGTRGLGYPPERVSAYATQLLQRVESVPGIQEASLSSSAPLVCCRFTDRVLRASGAGEDTLRVVVMAVSPSYFAVVGMSLLKGRTFTAAEMEADPAAPGPVVISEGLARALFQDQDPIGRAIRFRRPPERTVIGVAPNVHWDELTEPASDLSIYGTALLTGEMRPGSLLLVRSTLDDGSIEKTVREVAASIDPFVPLSQFRTLRAAVDVHTAEQSLFMKVLLLLALVAVSLASVGVAALVAQSVAERKREFGIRIAVGADRGDILRLVVRQGARLVLIGIPLGLVVAAAFGRLIRSKLFGVAPTEPTVYVAAAIGLLAVALLASFLPARAATRVDPVVALRSE